MSKSNGKAIALQRAAAAFDAALIRKVSVTLRLDRDVYDYFKSSGPGYQTRINAVLRAFVQPRMDENVHEFVAVERPRSASKLKRKSRS